MTKVSYQEELLYGPYASALRELGNAVQALDTAADLIRAYREESGDADQLAAGKTKPPPLDDQGRTPHTAWLDDVYETLNGLMRDARRSHRDLAVSFMDRWSGYAPPGIERIDDVSLTAEGTPLTEEALTEHLTWIKRNTQYGAGALVIGTGGNWGAAAETLTGSRSLASWQDLRAAGKVRVDAALESDRWGIRLVDPDVDG